LPEQNNAGGDLPAALPLQESGNGEDRPDGDPSLPADLPPGAELSSAGLIMRRGSRKKARRGENALN